MSRRHVWGIGLVLLAVAVASVAVAAPPKDAMVVGLLAEPVTMDPPQITDLNSTRVIKRMFEGLTAQELGTYKIVPGLAQSWDISKDGLTYTFHLRPNVKFHDGTPLTAEAVKFCFDRQMNDQGPFYATGTYPYVKGFLGNVAGVEVVNPGTVQIRLKSPLTRFFSTSRIIRSTSTAPRRSRSGARTWSNTRSAPGPSSSRPGSRGCGWC